MMVRSGWLCLFFCFLAGSASAGNLRLDQRKSEMMVALRKAQYVFTPSVRSAYLVYQKELAGDLLAEREQKVAGNFTAWVESDPVVEATVYGAHSDPAAVLAHLFSVAMDMGRENLEKYRQLALSAAVVSAKMGDQVDVTLRPPITLKIGGDPRVPVDTKNPDRNPDMYDHVINFLNSNTIEGYVVNNGNEDLPELRYDENGIAIPPPVSAVAATAREKKMRSLYAADVIASTNLQKRFNAYMKANGFDVQIDCGEQIIHWDARDMVRGEMNAKIDAAWKLFKTAYEEKGLLPKERDPFPSMGEKIVYLIRNHEYKFSDELQAARKWPRFPLTAPWPVMTILVADNQPLREREERWVAFREEGVFKTYGEYIGGVAQQFNMQSARRITPYPFTYGTIQMMLKDGGVCGTMGNISARSHITLGIPACTAGQPGHCAMIAYRFNEKEGVFECKGGQYATGGDDKTTPHAGWFFGEDAVREQTKGDISSKHCVRRPMIYHQSIAFAVNYGLEAFLDALMVYNIFNLLPEQEKKTAGLRLLTSGLEINPYSFMIADSLVSGIDDPVVAVRFWKEFDKIMAGVKDRPGCPSDGLYNRTVEDRVLTRLKELPVPGDRHAAAQILKFLEQEQCEKPETLAAYRLKLEGLQVLQSRTEREFADHLKRMQSEASRNNDVNGEKMAGTLKAVAECIRDAGVRKSWAAKLLETAGGNEKYFGHRYRVATDPAVEMLCRLAGRKLPPEAELMTPLINRTTRELEKSVSGSRSVNDCKQLASRIGAIGGALTDSAQKRQFVELLSRLIQGKESFSQKGSAKIQRDPCADVIEKLRLSLDG